MKLVEWDEFTKDELVEILKQLEQHALPVERFMVGDDVVYPKRCECMAEEERLPEQLWQLRESALERKARQQHTSVFGKLLRRPPVSRSIG